MKKLNLFAAACIAVLFHLSCQKEPGFGEELITNKVKTYTEEINSPVLGYIKETFDLRYDQQDRITGLVSTTTPGNKFIYAFPGEKECIWEIYGENVLTIKTHYSLNDLNFLDSAFQTNNEGDTTTTKYFYNPGKQLVAMWEYEYTTAGGSQLWDITEFSYDNKGRLIEESDSYSLTLYEYDPEVTGPAMISPPFLPPHPYLPTKRTYTSGGETHVFEYQYTFDTEGRLTREQMEADDGSIVVKSYSYW